MNEPRKLNIRIKFTAPKNNVPEKETIYIYHWQRIIGAALLVIVAVAALIGSGLHYCDQQQMENSDAKTASAEKRQAAVHAPPLYKEQKMATQRPEIKVKAPTPSPVKDSAIQARSNSKPLPSPSSNEENSNSLTANKEVSPAEAEQPGDAPASLFTQSKVEIFSAHIKRFVIAKTVKNREPVGSINDIDFDGNNIATVYAYSTAVGLKGETLYYKWRLNGKDIAQIKIEIGAERWRSYSRKFISPDMQGEWSVALENKKGETLAINRFHY